MIKIYKTNELKPYPNNEYTSTEELTSYCPVLVNKMIDKVIKEYCKELKMQHYYSSCTLFGEIENNPGKWYYAIDFGSHSKFVWVEFDKEEEFNNYVYGKKAK